MTLSARLIGEIAVPHTNCAFALQAGTGARTCQNMEHVAKYGATRAHLAHYAAVLAVRTAVQGGGK